MKEIAIKYKDTDRQLELYKFLGDHFVGSLASSSEDGVELATIFFVNSKCELYFKSRTESAHSRNLKVSNKVAFSAYSHLSNYKVKYGVQAKGFVDRILDQKLMSDVVNSYGAAFEGSGAKLPSISELCSQSISSTFYRLTLTEFKIVDEGGPENRTMLSYEKISDLH